MTCTTCSKYTKGITVSQSFLDCCEPIMHTKAQTPDPTIVTSPQAFGRFRNEYDSWLKTILRDSLENLSGPALISTQAALAQIELNIASNAEIIPAGIEDFLKRVANYGVTMGLGQVSATLTPDLRVDAVNRQIKEQMVRLSEQGRITSQHTFREIVGDGLETGESIRSLTDRVQSYFEKDGDGDRAIRWRAERIARTEASRSLNEGQVTAWKESGVTRMQWAIAPNPCQFCAAVSTKMQSVDVPFFNQGDRITGVNGGVLKFDYSSVKSPPLHPNCRCTLLPDVP
tara:strand:+ start:624 stop:1481 length:858 start_codon:yes stop_codon:yes gene_type:complete